METPRQRRPDQAHGARVETFVVAAFAFAVTLLVISVDAVPASIPELVEALKAIPAFAASFALISLFWYFHHRWCSRYKLGDGITVVLSLLLVFLVLVYVYPLKMLTASVFHGISGGWMPAGFRLESAREVLLLYVVYGLGFGALGATLALLYQHAWRQRASLDLDVTQQLELRRDRSGCIAMAAAGFGSAVLALLLHARDSAWLLALPAMLYNLLWILPLWPAATPAEPTHASQGDPRP